jgi:uroporphyrinogen decarboxylase
MPEQRIADERQQQDFRTLPLAEMEAIVARFDYRVNAALRESPPTKDWVRQAIRRKGGERCPVRLKRLSLDVIIRYGDRLADLFCQYPDDVLCIQPYSYAIGYQPPEREDKVSELQVMMQPLEWTDEWGTRWGHGFGGVGASPIDWPIKDWSQLDDYLTHGMPDPLIPGRLAAALSVLEMHGKSKYCAGMIHLALFERLHCLRGMENALTDLYWHEPEFSRLTDALTDYVVQLIGVWGLTEVSAIFLTDDWGSQTGLMISPQLWRKHFKPRYRRIFDEIHRWGKDVYFHSCGNVMTIVPDLIDLGVDILDPIQPGAMDLVEVARRFGGRVSFSGAIDDQRLERYTPPEVKQAVRSAVETLGLRFGNGFIVAPGNSVTPSVPIENLETLFVACRQNGH